MRHTSTKQQVQDAIANVLKFAEQPEFLAGFSRGDVIEHVDAFGTCVSYVLRQMVDNGLLTSSGKCRGVRYRLPQSSVDTSECPRKGASAGTFPSLEAELLGVTSPDPDPFNGDEIEDFESFLGQE
jgi:hypothetical protein